MQGTSNLATIGVLYPGEMGSALGRLLSGAGHCVVTTVDGRSTETARLATAAGLEVLGSLENVVAASDVLLSLVPPAAAASTARHATECDFKPDAIYVDANSIAPRTARAIAEMVEERGMQFVDAAIHGQSRRLPEHGVVYLSGAQAAFVGDLLEDIIKTRWLGCEPGRASAMKMLMGGVSKGLVALFVELALAAREASLLDEFLAGCGDWYPGVVAPVARMLPTYPRHAVRRADEMSELEQTLRDLGLEPEVVAGVRRWTARLAETHLHQYALAVDHGLFEIDDLIEVIALDNPLRPIEAAAERQLNTCRV